MDFGQTDDGDENEQTDNKDPFSPTTKKSLAGGLIGLASADTTGEGHTPKKEEQPKDQEYDDPTRNLNQDKKLTPGEIEEPKEHGWDHRDKGDQGDPTNLHKDGKGNVYQKPKGGNCYGDPIGVNLNDLFFTALPAGGKYLN